MYMDKEPGRITTIRLQADIRRQIEAFAKSERRTITSAVNYLLDKGLAVVKERTDDVDSGSSR